jgi:hypothetical protein
MRTAGAVGLPESVKVLGMGRMDFVVLFLGPEIFKELTGLIAVQFLILVPKLGSHFLSLHG